MTDSATNAATDACVSAEPMRIQGNPWLPALVCAALIVCAAAPPGLAEEPAEDATGEAAPAEATPAAAEPADTADADLPRHEDGTINYYQIVVDRYSTGVTPENNGAVPLVRAVGPKMFDEEVREEALAQLGLSGLSEDGPYLERLSDYYERTVPLDQQEDYDDIAVLDEITRRPWSAEDYPIAAGWLEDNEGPLALIAEATGRSHFYLPKISPNDPPTLISAFLPELTWARHVALALTARAMLKLDSGDVEGAWRDVLAVRRLARQFADGPFIIELLVGLGMEGIAINAGKTVLAGASPAPGQLQAMLTDTLELPPMQPLVDSLENERLSMLDIIEALKRDPSTDPLVGYLREVPVEVGNGGDATTWLGDENVDWEAVREATERWYDRSIAAAMAPDYAEHLRLTEELDVDFDEFVEDFPIDAPTLSEKREWLAMLMPDLSDLRTISGLYDPKSKLYTLALATQLYLARNGQYPAAVEELTPDYLPEVPIDGFTGEPMKYVRTDDGCKMYSLGPDMIDDGGFNYDDVRTMGGDSEKDEDFDDVRPEDIPEDADDIVIELGRAEE